MLILLPDPADLLDKALRERGEAMVVIADPAQGEAATIQSANDAWCRLVGQADGLAGRPLGEVRPMALLPGQWRAFITALRRFAPIQLDLGLRVDGRERWLQLRLTFDEDGAGNASRALLLGKDVSKARRRESEEGGLQRLLNAVFLEVSAPVAVLAEDGGVMMSNPAFQTLLGLSADALKAKTIGDLLAADHQVAAAAARAKQLKDGARFDLLVDLLHSSGPRVPVRLTCALLDEGDSRVRIVTALPEAAARADASGAAKPDLYGAPVQTEGEVLAISLKAVRAACADDWQRLAPRVNLLVEGAMKRRLAPADVFSRTDEDGFVIWFESRDSARNAATVAAIVRDIRLRVVVELAGQLQAPALAVRLGGEPALDAADHDPAASGRSASLAAELQPVVEQNGKVRPWCFVELPPAARRRAAAAGSGLAASAAADRLRCEAALTAATKQPDWQLVFVRVGWTSLAAPEHRRLLEEVLARAPATARARLVLVVYGVPAVPSNRRWLDVTSPLRPLLADIMPCITLAAGEQDGLTGTICAWPLTWLAFDGAEASSLPPDSYFPLIAAARRRDMTVLARAAPGDVRDWCELGANLVVAAPPGAG